MRQPSEKWAARINRTCPALLLFFLPALTVELLSGNTKLDQYFTPPVFVLMNVLYGGAALLIREVIVKWHKGIPSLLLLGAAYGMVNEGICSKGFFDPHFYAVTAFGLENVGRFMGFNVAWACSITAIHIIFSITAPILLVSALFPDNNKWLEEKTFYILLVIFAAVLLFFQKINGPYAPSVGEWTLLIALIGSLILAARFVPDFSVPTFEKTPQNTVMFILGVLFACLLFFVAIGLHKYIPFWVVEAVALVVLLTLFLWFLAKIPQEDGRARISLVIGMLTPQVLVAFASGQLIVAALIVALLMAIWTKSENGRAG